jgi:hypothetical protein
MTIPKILSNCFKNKSESDMKRMASEKPIIFIYALRRCGLTNAEILAKFTEYGLDDPFNDDSSSGKSNTSMSEKSMSRGGKSRKSKKRKCKNKKTKKRKCRK